MEKQTIHFKNLDNVEITNLFISQMMLKTKELIL